MDVVMEQPAQVSAFIYSPDLDAGGYPSDCQFDSSRPGRTRRKVFQLGLLNGPNRREVAPVPVTREELEWFHTPAYLQALRLAGEGDLPVEAFAMGLGTPDCPVFKGMYDYVSLAAGGTMTGARLILREEASVAFNPAGGFHHAMPGNCAGFCFINDVVLAAMELARAGKRVAFLDIDVHHCDGVQHAFYRRNDVMTVSLHEDGKTLFPGTGFENEIGEGDGRGYSVNIPLPVGTYDGAYIRAFEEAALPVIKAFNPDVMMVEIGMDTLAGDPLAHLHLTNNVVVEILERVLALGKPIVATGGGGYHIENTVRGWTLAWSALCGESAVDMIMGMGGVMLENTDWTGGLRDRMLLSDAGRRAVVDREVNVTIGKIRKFIFPIHGL